MKQQSKGIAVVTGASSGIGAIYADRLARRGYDLLRVARNRERMEDLAKKLVADAGHKVELLAADLPDSKELEGVERTGTALHEGRHYCVGKACQRVNVQRDDPAHFGDIRIQ